jgi:hypothetical protein
MLHERMLLEEETSKIYINLKQKDTCLATTMYLVFMTATIMDVFRVFFVKKIKFPWAFLDERNSANLRFKKKLILTIAQRKS